MTLKSDRQAYGVRTFRLVDEVARQRAFLTIQNAPIDKIRPVEVVVRDEVKRRGLDANALMWAGPLKDLSKQAWVDGRQFSADIWHMYLKTHLLPEEYDPELCMEGYRKYDYDPAGDRVLVGSTKQLTVKGMAQHIEAIHAFGANLGVMFSTKG